MTEIRVAYQAAFPGLAGDQVAGDILARCRLMLQEEPETRESYERAWLRYLARYHGLDLALRSGRIQSAAAFLDWIEDTHAPGFRTVANRCQELMRSDARLKPQAETEARRQRQRTQGVVR